MTLLLVAAVIFLVLYLFWLALQDILYLIDHPPEDEDRWNW